MGEVCNIIRIKTNLYFVIMTTNFVKFFLFITSFVDSLTLTNQSDSFGLEKKIDKFVLHRSKC